MLGAPQSGSVIAPAGRFDAELVMYTVLQKAALSTSVLAPTCANEDDLMLRDSAEDGFDLHSPLYQQPLGDVASIPIAFTPALQLNRGDVLPIGES